MALAAVGSKFAFEVGVLDVRHIKHADFGGAEGRHVERRAVAGDHRLQRRREAVGLLRLDSGVVGTGVRVQLAVVDMLVQVLYVDAGAGGIQHGDA